MDYEPTQVTADAEHLPPGTQRIETSAGTKIVLSPVPTSDPNQPLNWPRWRKVLHMTLLCIYTILTFAVLTVATPLWVPINAETGVSLTDLNYAYATSSGTLAVGCIFFVPLGMKFGRRPVYIVTSILMTASAIWQGKANTTGDFIGSNFIAGLAGAVNEALFQVTVTDLFFVHQRASANGLYLAAVCFGNYMGPVAAGYVVLSQGWRWAFYYLTIFMGTTTIALIFTLEESKYPSPAVRGESVPATNYPTQDSSSKAKVDKDLTESTIPASSDLSTQATQCSNTPIFTIPINSYRKRHAFYTQDPDASGTNTSLFRHIYQPFEVLIQFPAVAFAALQYGWLVSMLSVVAVTQAVIYPVPPYNFSAAKVGLMSLPPAIGALIGSLLGGPLIDYLTVQIAKKRRGIHEPEVRLWCFIVPGCSMVIGVSMYGLTIAQGMPWIINAIGAGFVGFALGGCGDIALTYVQDSYQFILGDALVGVVFVRNAISTGMIFAVPPWMTNMGIYDMFVVCAVLAAVIALTHLPLLIWGRRWRIALAPEYQKYAERQY